MNKQCNFRTAESGSWPMAVCLLAIVFVLSACGFDGRADHQSNETSETGSFACTLVWPESLDDDGHTSPSARALNCEAAGIDSVVFTFFQNGTEADQIGFECTDHEGEAVLPVGSGYEVIITAEDADGTSWYQAEYGPFSITAGGTTSPPGGIIEMISVVVGEWNVYYDWDCDGTDGIAIFTVDSDNTLTVYDPFYGETYYGTWSILADQITGSLSDGSVYIGTFDAGLNQMEGTMADANSYAGCWVGVPSDTDDNYEDNDTLETAYDITDYKWSDLSTIDGYGVAQAGDVDWYRIQVDPDDMYLYVESYFYHEYGDIDIELYTIDQNLGKKWLAGAYSETDDEYIVWDLTDDVSDTYYILVYLASDAGANTYDLYWDAY